ncbi:MAG: hypothetical protein ISS34_04520 [Candidatus Omnitrophica bacterium]|nr:hypothetical protein [Candidatus Omnitrophota bacterium]
MIEINLLPENLRKKKPIFQMPEIKITSAPIIIGIAVLLVLIHGLTMLTINLQRRAIDKMSVEWQREKIEKESIELTRRENIKMRRKIDAIEDLMSRKILWAKKLNQLSDLVIDGIWYTSLSIDRKTVIVEPKEGASGKSMAMRRFATERVQIPYLSIEGEVSSSYGDELAIISRFIDGLKSEKDFFKDFSNIELDSTTLHEIENVEVMKFNINCYIKEFDEEA